MGTDNIKLIKNVKSLVLLMSITKCITNFSFFLKLFAKRNIKFCKHFWKNTISVLEDLYQIEYHLLENIHFFHYRKTCMKSSIISWIDITYPEVTQVHIGWMECRLMFTPPQKKHKSSFHPT